MISLHANADTPHRWIFAFDLGDFGFIVWVFPEDAESFHDGSEGDEFLRGQLGALAVSQQHGSRVRLRKEKRVAMSLKREFRETDV